MRWIRHKGHSIRVPDTMQKVERDGYTETSGPQVAINKPSAFDWNAPLIDEDNNLHHDGCIEGEEDGDGQ